MNDFKYPHLFEPIKLAGTMFKNRIFAAPTGFREFTAEDFIPTEGMAYYERKAKGGAASVCIGETVVSSALGKHGPTHLVLDNPRANNSLHRLTSVISRHGAIASAELMHAGWASNRNLNPPGEAYAPVECVADGRLVPAMPEEIIERTIAEYGAAAAFAKRCGFGMVTIHAGHGWMLHQWMSPLTNTRNDKWGGSLENRMRMPLAIMDAVRKAVGPNFPIEVRISGSEAYPGGYDIDEGVRIAKMLDGKIDLLHVSTGNYDVDEVFVVTHPSMFLDEGCNVKYAAEIKKHVKMPVATVGALGDPEMMEEIIASGKADVVEMARSLLADPDLPNKIRTGRESEVRPCLRCLNCFSELLPTGWFSCAVNPETGHELELRYEVEESEKQKVLIIGGGPAGMQAALTCAQRGHEVILCEKSSRLGGVLRCEEKVSFKWRLEKYLNYMQRQVEKSNIEVRLNTDVTPDYARSVEADVIIAAVGAAPIVPPIPGIDGKIVVASEAAYAGTAEIGENVVILGAGLVGTELGIHLAINGKNVQIVEMTDHINHGGNFLYVKALDNEIRDYKIGMNFLTKAVEIKEDGVECVNVETGEKRFFKADTVIYAVGMKPLHAEAKSFYDCAKQFHFIGDCAAAANIRAATSKAYFVAKDVGRFI